MNVRTILQLANATATAALAVALVETWREVRTLRRWTVDNAVSEERLRQKLSAALDANGGALQLDLGGKPAPNGKAGYPHCVRPGCGHSARAHGDQSGHPTPNDPCHAAVIIGSPGDGSLGESECPCTGYRYRYQVGERSV
jgi:hypothetical protein